jgi:hypothetical protein
VACRIALRPQGGTLTPVVWFGGPALAPDADPAMLVFTVARRLADLRADRIARLLCPRTDELAQIVDFAMTLAAPPSGAATTSLNHTARWLAEVLSPVDLDQVVTIGERLVERETNPTRAALDWLEATERTADRIGYILTGHIAPCVQVLDKEPASRTSPQERIIHLVWASITESVLQIRGRREHWEEETALSRQPALDLQVP